MEDTSLADVFLSHQGHVSDKWEHYLEIYQAEMSRFAVARRPVRLLEVGVQNGGSLEIWSRYFPAGSTIVGIDIDPACASVSLNENVKILIADAGDPKSINSALGEQHFDIIIDDGSHRSSDIITTFRCCFPLLESGGIYIIEDLHTSYWRSMGGGFRQPGAAMEWLKGLIDALNTDHFDDQTVYPEGIEELRTLNTEIRRITFFDSAAVIEKRSANKSRPYRRFLTGEEASIWQPFKVIASGSTDAARNFLLSDSASKAMNVALLDQLSAEREDNRAFRANLANKEASLAKVRSWLGQTGRMLSKSEARVEVLSSTLRDAMDDLAKVQAKTDEFSRELSNTRALLHAIYTSTSWRVTTPLRWLGNYFRSERRGEATADAE